MNAQNNPSGWSKVTGSITFKAVSIGFLMLLLLIPVDMVSRLIRDRQHTGKSVMREVSSKWGEEQVFTGPVMKVPYTYYTVRSTGIRGVETEQIEVEDYAYFLPETLDIKVAMEPEVLYRSIYNVVVYQAKMTVRGSFKQPDFDRLNIKPVSIDWANACLYVGISDMRGVRNEMVLNWNNQPLNAIPGIERSPVLASGLTFKTPLKQAATAETDYAFSCELLLNGSKCLSFTPVGKSTRVETSSTWATPSFDGAFLPDNRNISAAGFTADWSILNYNRNYPQAWIGEAPSFSNSNFSVGLTFPVDHYQQSTRAVKYAVMFIVLTFLMFFMVELISRKPVHIIQYLLVGAGLILFYCLLLAFSEQMNFALAYVISATAIVGLITGYSYAIFRRWTQTLMVGALFSILYLSLYVVLQLKDLALLVGSVGLFIVLAVIMYVSRKINWFQSREPKPQE